MPGPWKAPIGVVVDEDEIGSPHHPRRVRLGQSQVDDGYKSSGPGLDGAQGVDAQSKARTRSAISPVPKIRLDVSAGNTAGSGCSKLMLYRISRRQGRWQVRIVGAVRLLQQFQLTPRKRQWERGSRGDQFPGLRASAFSSSTLWARSSSAWASGRYVSAF